MRDESTQLLFRAVNDRIVALHRTFGVGSPVIEVLCECRDAACMERVPLSPEAYERLRAAPGRFVVIPEHESSATAATAA